MKTTESDALIEADVSQQDNDLTCLHVTVVVS